MVSATDLCIPRFHDVLGDVMAHGVFRQIEVDVSGW